MATKRPPAKKRTTTKAPLRAATEQDAAEAAAAAEAEAAAAKKKPKTLLQAVEDDDYLGILIAQRRQMVSEVGSVGGPAKAAMHRQIALLSKEIAVIQEAAREEEGRNGEGVPEDEDFDSEAI